MKSFLKFKVPKVSTGVAVSNGDSFSAVTNRRTLVNPSNFKTLSIFLMDKSQFDCTNGYFYKLYKSVKPSPQGD
jgi:hypothetical protein